MIAEIFPKGFQRYESLPVLGPLMDRYAEWLRQQQYTWPYRTPTSGPTAAQIPKAIVEYMKKSINFYLLPTLMKPPARTRE